MEEILHHLRYQLMQDFFNQQHLEVGCQGRTRRRPAQVTTLTANTGIVVASGPGIQPLESRS